MIAPSALVVPGLLLAFADPTIAEPIYGGEPTPGAEFDSAVLLQGSDWSCSAVMVSPTIGLTAAHCLDDLGFGEGATAYYGPSRADGEPHQVARFGIHPGYCRNCGEDRRDLAFIETTLPMASLDNPAVPIVVQGEWDLLVRQGQAVTAVGYGAGTGSERPERHRIPMEIDEVSKNGREVTVSSSRGGTCDGDSGGPLFGRLGSGALRLVGVHSRSVGGCPGDWGISSTPYSSLCWLRDETNLDLLSPGDDDCELVDTRRDGCCTVGGASPRGTALLVLVLMLALRGRGWPHKC